ncbi:MAG: serine hydrolase domain-containing protein [Rhodothalassiaceae bacterium]
MRLIAAALCAVSTVSAFAQETEATIDAYAAGYKAALTCSGVFNAGKSVEQIAADELTGIYPLVAETVQALPAAVIDREAGQVRVRYSPTMPPRVAQWRPHLGCVQLPVGAPASAGKHMPRITADWRDINPRQDDGAPWTRHAAINGSSGNAALDQAIDAAFTGGFGQDAKTSTVLIATPDTVLAERYAAGFDETTSQRTWSVAKSIAATVIGAAAHQGLIDVKAPADLANWSHPVDPRGAITVEHLLHMSSGLDSNRAGNRTDRLYLGGGLVTDTATQRALEAKPGTRWKYANNDTLLAVRALTERLGGGQAALRFPFEALLYRIGMTHTRPETDWRGDFILSSQVWTTARDLARLGVLYLNDGVWDGERILPPGWVAYVSTPAPAQPPETGSRGAIPGYGAQWWLYNERFPELPNDAFAARGNRGQYVMIIPSRDLVIVRRGYDPAGGEGFELHRFTEAVLKALGVIGLKCCVRPH